MNKTYFKIKRFAGKMVGVVLLFAGFASVHFFTQTWDHAIFRRTGLADARFQLDLYNENLPTGTPDSVVVFGPNQLLVSRCAKLRAVPFDSDATQILSDQDVSLSLQDKSAIPGTFYEDANCFNPQTKFVLPAGKSQLIFYYQNKSAGHIQINPGSDQFSNVDWNSESMIGNVAFIAMDWKSAPSGVTCSGPYHLRSYDYGKNDVPIDSTEIETVQINYESGDARFYSDSSCGPLKIVTAMTFPSGTTSTEGVYFKGSTESSIHFLLEDSFLNTSVIWTDDSAETM